MDALIAEADAGVADHSVANAKSSRISVGSLAPAGVLGLGLQLIAPLVDRVLGIDALADRYREIGVTRLSTREAVAQILQAQEITIEGAEALAASIPKSGPVVVVCNHPHGGIEGLVMAHALSGVRSDVKILANSGLRVLTELRDLFIFTNPLSRGNVGNVASLRQCERHLRSGGLLVVFPAGAVSSFQPSNGFDEDDRIADAAWSRSAAQLATSTGATLVGTFISGTNSPLFHNLGRLHYRFRLLMLAREMLKVRRKTITLTPTRPLPATTLKRFGNAREVTDLTRALVYLKDPAAQPPSSVASGGPTAMLAAASDAARITMEVAALPREQHLFQHQRFSVHYGYQHQLPETVREIARLREFTFRQLDEGSGQSLDTDRFDATYVHLFARDDDSGEIIGAYRLGQTDLLLRDGDLSQLYLSAMFTFGPQFLNRREPCLELGRSFVVPSHQRSPHALFLLWKGIGAFLCQHPRYRTLYGTVSLSTTYAPRSIDVIARVLSQPDDDVQARAPFRPAAHPELLRYLADRTLSMQQLSHVVQALEPDGKDVPVLVKQYAKLGARFYCVGIDRSFRDTPGLLLSIDVPSAPTKQLQRYLGDGLDAYVQHGALNARDARLPC